MEIFIKENGKMGKLMDRDVLLIIMEACMMGNGLMINNMDTEQKVGIIIKSNTRVILFMEKRVGLEDLNLKVAITKGNFSMVNLTDMENTILLTQENYMKVNLKIITWMEKEL
jgi:hypothetical protein